MKPGDPWERLQPGEQVELRALSPLHRETYSVDVIGRGPDRVRLSYPMAGGRLILLPVGCTVSLRRRATRSAEVWTKVVGRVPGPNRCLLLACPSVEAPLVSMRPRATRGLIIAVVGSKGGVGTSVLAANLASLLASDGDVVCLVDAAQGSGHVDVLLNVFPRWTLRDVLRGERSPFEAAAPGPGSLLLLASGGHIRTVGEEGAGPRMVVRALQQMATHAAVVVVDTGSGWDPYAAEVLATADERIVVTTTEPHGVMEAYTLLHEMGEHGGRKPWRLVVNMAPTVEEGKRLGQKMEFAARQFLQTPLTVAAVLTRDRALEQSVRRRRLLIHHAPRSAAAKILASLATSISEEHGLAMIPRTHRWSIWSRLWRGTKAPSCL